MARKAFPAVTSWDRFIVKQRFNEALLDLRGGVCIEFSVSFHLGCLVACWAPPRIYKCNTMVVQLGIVKHSIVQCSK